MLEMSDDTDFVSMYEELGLDAGMRHARVQAGLSPPPRGRAPSRHPGHRLGSSPPATPEPPLRGDAGFPPPARTAAGRVGTTASRVPPWPPPTTTAPVREAPAGEAIAPRGGRRRYLLIGALAAALLYWLGAGRTSVPTLDPAGPGGDAATAAWQPASRKRLELGMSIDQARRILGDPTTEHAARWQYGPSWVVRGAAR